MLPLLDREAELAALSRAVQGVADGTGGVVLVEGGPGAGKSRLLAETRALCRERGVRTLSARGSELEREHPYGIVRQLFETALLGSEQADWIAGPAAAASSVFRPETEVDAAPFATLSGLYWLTVNAAADVGPLVLVVDDLHWADRPSLHFLQYLVRRQEGLGVLLLLGGRPERSDLLEDLASAPTTTLLQPTPLSQAAAERLAGQLLGVEASNRFAAACQRATRGNPLLLVELLRALRADGVVPDDEHLDVIDHVGPSAVARIVLVRLRRLPGPAVAVAQAIALLGSGAATSLVAGLAEVDERAVAQAFAALIEADIVDAQPPLGFVHPIVRDAVYQELAPDERDRAHARAAELLHARAAEPDQVGAHLLLCAPRGLPWVSEVLQAAAADAAQRGAVESAVVFLRRALAERPADADPELLLRLGLTEAAVDATAAVGYLDAARRAAPDPSSRARIGELVARLQVWSDPLAAIAAARQARAELPADEDGATANALIALEHYAGRFNAVDLRPFPAPDPSTAQGRMLMAVAAWHRALSGGSARECAQLAADALLLDDPTGSRRTFVRNPLFTAIVASSVLVLADDPRARTFWEAWHAEALREGRAHAVIAGGVWQAWMGLRLGELAAAEASLRSAMEGPRLWGPGTQESPAHTVALLAEVLLERGEIAAARAALDSSRGRERVETEGALQCENLAARVLAAEGRFQEALDTLAAVSDRLSTVTNPTWNPWREVRADALFQLGRREEAVEAASEALALARAWGTPAPIGLNLRLLGTFEGRAELLEEAVEVTRSPWARLEHARALFALGSALRRGRRPSEARALLRDAHDLAARCGADLVARRARDELATAGGRPRAVAGSGAEALTPSERRVADLAASGRRNQEIAQQLHLSPKTVEVHLSSAYRKLGIRARGELAEALEPLNA